MLDDVVVVAYGTAKKSSFTGSATAVSGEKIAKMQVSSVSKALEGAAAGVQVINTSGQPGENAKIPELDRYRPSFRAHGGKSL